MTNFKLDPDLERKIEKMVKENAKKAIKEVEGRHSGKGESHVRTALLRAGKRHGIEDFAPEDAVKAISNRRPIEVR